jgi:hypothetical protein
LQITNAVFEGISNFISEQVDVQLIVGRGLHSSTFQLNLSRFQHKINPKYLPIPPNSC